MIDDSNLYSDPPGVGKPLIRYISPLEKYNRCSDLNSNGFLKKPNRGSELKLIFFPPRPEFFFSSIFNQPKIFQ